ncbi:maleylacetoacetate isomerase [Parasphingorhabdus sp.]|uniref:maleylacetoacetate isomerase n=1 Tax=Parasphingorhabdus sp. TaxID=2709688 RepID=UPI003262FC54
MKLYDFPRSSASFRVRIALNLKGCQYETVKVDFATGDQMAPSYRQVNPSGLVPFVEFDDGVRLSQSMAIMKYLDRLYPSPRLLPENVADEAAVMEMAMTIACDIHPLNNLRVLKYLEQELGADEAARQAWYANWVRAGFSGLEALVAARSGGARCFGDELTAVDVCLVPQMFNARRFSVPLDDFSTLVEIDRVLQDIPAFRDAAP